MNGREKLKQIIEGKIKNGERIAWNGLGAAVKENREKIGLSLELLSKKSGIQKEILENLENQNCDLTFDENKKIAEILQINPVDLTIQSIKKSTNIDEESKDEAIKLFESIKGMGIAFGNARHEYIKNPNKFSQN